MQYSLSNLSPYILGHLKEELEHQSGRDAFLEKLSRFLSASSDSDDIYWAAVELGSAGILARVHDQVYDLLIVQNDATRSAFMEGGREWFSDSAITQSAPARSKTRGKDHGLSAFEQGEGLLRAQA